MTGNVGDEPIFHTLDEQDPDSPAGVLWAAAQETGSFRWVISRDHHNIQPDKTISREAMDAVVLQISAWIEARIMERWRRTNEAPTIVTISVRVDAQ
jgi:hypothetical protein